MHARCTHCEDDGWDLPEEFAHKVRHALEYSMSHNGLDEEEKTLRRWKTETWLDTLHVRDAYEEWAERCRIQPPSQEKVEAKERAQGRAEDLLRSALSEGQLQEFVKKGYFHVQVGDRKFRITKGRSHNVKEVDDRSRILRSFCAHPTEHVPDADTMLAQKLILETDPDAFFKLANVMRATREEYVPRDSEAFRQTVVENIQIVHELRRVHHEVQEEQIVAALDETAAVERPAA